MAQVVHLKAFKARSRRRRVEAPGGMVNARMPELRTPAVGTNFDAARVNPEAMPPVAELLKLIAAPLVILLCSIAAFIIFVAHVSGQPAYSARTNISPSTFIE